MAKWTSNLRQLNELWNIEGMEVRNETQVFGIEWNTTSDTFNVGHGNVTNRIAEDPATKRQLLQATARFHDPLGLLSPVSVMAKILFQDTWTRGIGWDELLPHDLSIRWHLWLSTLHTVSALVIPRWIGVSDRNLTQMHVFCDASERSYGAALYVRTTAVDKCSVHLVCSKSRLSPIKRVTLPRLELLAALIGSRLLHYFCKATNFDSTAQHCGLTQR